MYSTSGVRQQIDTTLSLAQLRATPEAYKDRVVMLGGGDFECLESRRGHAARNTAQTAR